ncbi:hypothetical protein [Burkholderia pyrrocinia]
MTAIAILLLAGWSTWYARHAQDRDLPHGNCIMSESVYRSVLDSDVRTRSEALLTSFWLDAGRIGQKGCYEPKNQDLSIDRTGSIQTLFREKGEVLIRVSRLGYSPFDDAKAQPVPGPLENVGGEADLRFHKLTDNAWIVEASSDRAGMCILRR